MSKKRINDQDLSLQPLDLLFGEEIQGDIQEVPLKELYEFKNHPFKVMENDELTRLIESIRESGIIVPLLVRPIEDGRLEIIAGHRRRKAAEIIGLETVPAIIHDFTDDEATIMMVDSNIQRETILPSEKAFAYSMKMNALKHQGKKIADASHSAETIGKENSDSIRQVHRYMRLTNLNEELLEYVDQGKIGLVAGEELSFLKDEEQTLLVEFLKNYNKFPSSEQSKVIHGISKEKKLVENDLIAILASVNPKPTKIVLKHEKIKDFFDEETSSEEIENIIIELLTQWKLKKV